MGMSPLLRQLIDALVEPEHQQKKKREFQVKGKIYEMIGDWYTLLYPVKPSNESSSSTEEDAPVQPSEESSSSSTEEDTPSQSSFSFYINAATTQDSVKETIRDQVIAASIQGATRVLLVIEVSLVINLSVARCIQHPD